jgi:photosystem II stability/assembly factor-like uncharacterized protein
MMFYQKQLSIAAICMIGIFISCKKEIEVEFYFESPQVVESNQNNMATISVVCELYVLGDDYQIDEFGVLWGTSTDLENTGTRQNFGREPEFDETVNVDYGFIYYFKPYAILDGIEYYGNLSPVDAGPVPPSWKLVSSTPEVCSQLAVSPAGIIHAFGNEGRQYYSSDEGATWMPVNHINTNYLSKPTFIDENVIYVWAQDAIRKSTNGGLSWTQIAFPPNLGIGDVFFYDAKTIFCGVMDSVYRSDNSGATWTGTGIGAVESSTIVTGVHFFNSSIGYAITHAGEVSKTTDGGASWTLQTSEIIDIYVPGEQIYAVTETDVVAATSTGLFYSNNSGLTWEFKGNWIGSPLTEIDFCDALHGIAVFSNGTGKTRLTSDGGLTWEEEYLPNYVTDVELVGPTKAYAVNGVTGLVFVFD